MIIDAISDLHGDLPDLPGGDLLILAGDYTGSDKVSQWCEFFRWLEDQKYKYKVYIGGNHDNFLSQCISTQESKDLGLWEDPKDIEYLLDSGSEFQGLKIWGTPWSKTFPGINPHCKAFTVDTEEELAKKYAKIPGNTDIVISHCPMWGILDSNRHGIHCGSVALREAVNRIKPRVLICGHIHEHGGSSLLYKHTGVHTWIYNVSILNEDYDAVNKPTRIEL